MAVWQNQLVFQPHTLDLYFQPSQKSNYYPSPNSFQSNIGRLSTSVGRVYADFKTQNRQVIWQLVRTPQLLQHIIECMGTIQSKIKEGYNVRKKTILKRKSQRGVNPTYAFQSKNIVQPYLNIETSSQTISKSKKKSATHSSPHLQTLSSFSDSNLILQPYPSSAVGIIQSRINNSIRLSLGGLIASNIVLTTASSLSFLKSSSQLSNIKFTLNNGDSFEISKHYIAQKFTNPTLTDANNHPKTSSHDYAILLLKNHANIHQTGILGFDFTTESQENDTFTTFFRIIRKNNCFKVISRPFTDYSAEDNGNLVLGGPVVIKKGNESSIVGLESSNNSKDHKINSFLRLNEDMFSQISSWVTQDEEEIDLRDKNLGKQGIKKLIKHKWTTLASINISRNNIGIDGLKYFVKCQWSNLHYFDIGGNNIQKQGVSHLIKIVMRNLLTLNMWGNSIGSEGAIMLVESNWKNLNSINLYNNEIGNEGSKHLVNADWIELESLNLGKNKLNNEAVPFLKHAQWKELVSLNLWGNMIKNEKAILNEINKYFGKIKFLYL